METRTRAITEIDWQGWPTNGRETLRRREITCRVMVGEKRTQRKVRFSENLKRSRLARIKRAGKIATSRRIEFDPFERKFITTFTLKRLEKIYLCICKC